MQAKSAFGAAVGCQFGDQPLYSHPYSANRFHRPRYNMRRNVVTAIGYGRTRYGSLVAESVSPYGICPSATSRPERGAKACSKDAIAAVPLD